MCIFLSNSINMECVYIISLYYEAVTGTTLVLCFISCPIFVALCQTKIGINIYITIEIEILMEFMWEYLKLIFLHKIGNYVNTKLIYIYLPLTPWLSNLSEWKCECLSGHRFSRWKCLETREILILDRHTHLFWLFTCLQTDL